MAASNTGAAAASGTASAAFGAEGATSMTLAEEFLCDLDEDEDNNAEGEEQASAPMTREAAAAVERAVKDVAAQGAGPMEVTDLKATDAKDIAKLLFSKRLEDLMKKVEHFSSIERTEAFDKTVNLESNEEYQLMQQANNMAVDLSNEIEALHKFMRDMYAARFPELESLVPLPIEYAKTVLRIGTETDMTRVDLADILAGPTIMGVAVSASTTRGKPLDSETYMKVIDTCNMLLRVDATRQKILDYVESRMLFIAPNVTAVVGSTIAAKLMGAAGGLNLLARLPSCVIQILGQKKASLAGYSATHYRMHTGFVYDCDIIKSTPLDLRTRACRLIAGKLTLAVRVDNNHDASAVTGEIGRKLRDFVVKRIEKWQEPPPAKAVKPLPAPDDKPKKRRGGRRVRKMKERYALTDVRKQANRMQFGGVEETYRDTGIGFGMLGAAGSGKLRVTSVDKGLLKKVKKDRLTSTMPGTRTAAGLRSSGIATSGLSSSLAFTPVQGIELENPEARKAKLQQALADSHNYFAETAGFKKS
eukprot:TRINITY_DN7524_c0_g1_i1.p1 TRINITY_DN7524_c0_g1~~TRINITY_DN7524_c0_g1_i1.p1  ORF type:complete len:532 (-),score=170.64 TRINITY_DN7524_c0_g1_i1:69-1664(-)